MGSIGEDVSLASDDDGGGDDVEFSGVVLSLGGVIMIARGTRTFIIRLVNGEMGGGVIWFGGGDVGLLQNFGKDFDDELFRDLFMTVVGGMAMSECA